MPLASAAPRSHDRVAEGAGLLILCRGNLTEGSNPSDSEQHESRLLPPQAAFVLLPFGALAALTCRLACADWRV